MFTLKRALFLSGAGIVLATGASAADLGVKKPTAIEYVKTCPTYGAGFFVVPGTTSCIKLIGRVRFERASRSDSTLIVRSTARLWCAARGQTPAHRFTIRNRSCHHDDCRGVGFDENERVRSGCCCWAG